MFLYKSHRDRMMIASTAFTMIYTVLASFVSVRARSVWSRSDDRWFTALETVSYLQCFNAVFLFACVMHMTGALRFASRQMKPPQFGQVR